MSLSPHREKDAKVEGRDPPEMVTGTMAPFRSLIGKLLKVPMSEVKEQQHLYEETRSVSKMLKTPKKKVQKTTLARVSSEKEAKRKGQNNNA